MRLIVLVGQEEVVRGFQGGGAIGAIFPAFKLMAIQIAVIGGGSSLAFHPVEEMAHRR
jgi:hypothetical protein